MKDIPLTERDFEASLTYKAEFQKLTNSSNNAPSSSGTYLTLPKRPLISNVIHSLETTGAITFNYTPEYYMPESLLHPPPQTSKIPMTNRLQSLIHTWLIRYPTRTVLIDNFSDLYAFNAEIILDYPNIHKRTTALSPEMYLIVVRLFHLVNHLHPAQDGFAIETAIGMASVLHANILRDALGCYFTTLSHALVERLMAAVFPDADEWVGLQEVRLWCLVQGGIVSEGRDRMLFVRKTREVMAELGCGSWEDASGILADIMYVEELFGKKCAKYGNEVVNDEWWMEC